MSQSVRFSQLKGPSHGRWLSPVTASVEMLSMMAVTVKSSDFVVPAGKLAKSQSQHSWLSLFECAFSHFLSRPLQGFAARSSYRVIGSSWQRSLIVRAHS